MPREVLIYVADDDDAVRRSLVMLLEGADYRTAAFASGEAMLAMLDQPATELPGCAVLDVRMGAGMTGLDVQQALTRRFGARIPVVMVTGHADVPMAVSAMRAGVKDFIEKPYPPDRLLEAVALALGPPAPPPSILPSLTAREMEVLTALVTGQSNKEIARALGISHRTVEVHRASMMNRLGARNLAEAVRIGLSAGLGAPATAQQ